MHQYLTLIFFILAYLLFIFFSKQRTYFAFSTVILLILTGCLSFKQAFSAVNWNVMGVFLGMQAMAHLFIKSRVPAFISELIVDKAKNTKWAIILICALTSFISAFVDNVATVLIVAPIALMLADKIKINPMNMMIAIAVCSNLQGAATLIGDPPSMLLAGFAKMNFMDFFFYQGKPSIFFAVQLGAIVSLFVLIFIFRKEKKKSPILRVEKIQSLFPAIWLVLLIFTLAASSFLKTNYPYVAGTICLCFGIILLAWEKIFNKGKLIECVKSFDWDTALFLMSVFIMVGSLTIAGWINAASSFLTNIIGTNLFIGYTVLVFVAVILSAFIDNIPFLATMLPVAIAMANHLQVNPALFLFGLLIGASLGGNITPIGASANIVACGLLKKHGHAVSFKDFMKIGLPFTLSAVIAAYLFIWFIWGK